MVESPARDSGYPSPPAAISQPAPGAPPVRGRLTAAQFAEAATASSIAVTRAAADHRLNGRLTAAEFANQATAASLERISALSIATPVDKNVVEPVDAQACTGSDQRTCSCALLTYYDAEWHDQSAWEGARRDVERFSPGARSEAAAGQSARQLDEHSDDYAEMGETGSDHSDDYPEMSEEPKPQAARKLADTASHKGLLLGQAQARLWSGSQQPSSSMKFPSPPPFGRPPTNGATSASTSAALPIGAASFAVAKAIAQAADPDETPDAPSPPTRAAHGRCGGDLSRFSSFGSPSKANQSHLPLFGSQPAESSPKRGSQLGAKSAESSPKRGSQLGAKSAGSSPKRGIQQAPPAPSFKEKLDLVKKELCIDPATPALLAVQSANEMMGLESAGTLPSQVDALCASLSLDPMHV